MSLRRDEFAKRLRFKIIKMSALCSAVMISCLLNSKCNMLLFFVVVINGVNILLISELTSVNTKMSKNTHKFLCRLGIKYYYFGYLIFNGNILARYEVPLEPLKTRI